MKRRAARMSFGTDRVSSPVVLETKAWRGLPTDMWRSVAAFAASPSLPSTSKKHAFLTCNKAMCETGYPSLAAVNDMTLWYPPAQRYEHCARPCLQERVRSLLEWWNATWTKLTRRDYVIYMTVTLTEEALAQQKGPGPALVPRLKDSVTLEVNQLWIVGDQNEPSVVRQLPDEDDEDDEDVDMWESDWSEWALAGEEKDATTAEVTGEMLRVRENSGVVSFAVVTETLDALGNSGKRTTKWIQEHPEAIASVSLSSESGRVLLPRGRFDPAHTDRLVYIIPYLLTPSS